MKGSTLKSRIGAKVARSRREVFVRSDFADMAGYDQTGRVLRQLTLEGALIRIGYGLYAKACTNSITGKPMLSAPGGFAQVAKEALSRLGVRWKPSKFEAAYQAGSTQLPANTEVMVSEPFNRRIGTGKFKLRVIRA